MILYNRLLFISIYSHTHFVFILSSFTILRLVVATRLVIRAPHEMMFEAANKCPNGSDGLQGYIQSHINRTRGSTQIVMSLLDIVISIMIEQIQIDCICHQMNLILIFAIATLKAIIFLVIFDLVHQYHNLKVYRICCEQWAKSSLH